MLLDPFLEALCSAAGLTLHIRFYGENDHHMMECIFKALGQALRQAAAKGGMGIPSTKGVIREVVEREVARDQNSFSISFRSILAVESRLRGVRETSLS